MKVWLLKRNHKLFNQLTIMKKYKFLKYFVVLVLTYVLNGLICWVSSPDMGLIESFVWFETVITTFVLSVIPLTILYLLEGNDYEDLLNYLNEENDEKHEEN